MKISIITVVKNGAGTIEGTIKSVLGQSHDDIEFIVIDGGSTDGTLDIIEKYKDRLSKMITGKDGGIYDAMNKGIKAASGDIIAILNSDDVYSGDDVISVVVKRFQETGADCVWGDLVYVDRKGTGRIVRYWQSSDYVKGKFERGWHPPHPSFFVRKSAYDRCGIFRTDLSFSADYELMFRFIEINGLRSSYIPRVLVRMRSGGVSNRNFYNIFLANYYCRKALMLNGKKTSPFFIIRKPLSKIGQLFIRHK